MSEITSLIMDGVVKASVQGTPATLQAQGLSPDTLYNTKVRYEKDDNIIESSVQGIRTLPAGSFSVSNTYIENDASTGKAILTFNFTSTYAISSIQVRYSGTDYQGSISGGKCTVELPTGLQYTSITFDINAIDIYAESFRVGQTGVYVEEAMSKQPFFVQLIDPTENRGNVQIIKYGSPTSLTLEYSTDLSTWNTYTMGDFISLTSAKPRVWFRNTGTTKFSTHPSNYYMVSPAGMSTGGAEVGGNIASLKSRDLSDTTTYYYDFRQLFNSRTSIGKANRLYLGNYDEVGNFAYSYMFKGCSYLTEVPELPATSLGESCYKYMFSGCTLLRETPELPATNTPWSCYEYMFKDCTSLVDAPKLPATTLGPYCYNGMFSGCTSLVNAPELSATTLNQQCYASMFKDCTSLVDAPKLPATRLTTGSYSNMFSGCTSLVDAPKLPATTLGGNCYASMFKDCTSLANAPELPVTTLASGCYYGMFQGCTSLVNAPDLPATTLSTQCYKEMFQGCTSLEKSPELPATTLKMECYRNMFKDCTSLEEITCLAEDISDPYCVTEWTYWVAQSGTFIKSPNMSSWPTGASGIPSGWTVQDYQ